MDKIFLVTAVILMVVVIKINIRNYRERYRKIAGAHRNIEFSQEEYQRYVNISKECQSKTIRITKDKADKEIHEVLQYGAQRLIEDGFTISR